MKLYLASFGAGLLVGVVYSLLGVRSPAPPAVALVGLLGVLLGEQIVPIARQVIAGRSLQDAFEQAAPLRHVLGELPGNAALGKARFPESDRTGP